MLSDRIILHADLDCFYCQVEQIRLGIPSTVPLAIQQWERIIAVNYAARSFGVTRHSSYRDCLEACPQIKLVHVATYSLENNCELRQYNASEIDNVIIPDRMKFKASLDPYRRVSLEILSKFKKITNMVEKASVDEAFLDITKEVDQELTRMLQSSHDNIHDLWSKLNWNLHNNHTDNFNTDNQNYTDKNDEKDNRTDRNDENENDKNNTRSENENLKDSNKLQNVKNYENDNLEMIPIIPISLNSPLSSVSSLNSSLSSVSSVSPSSILSESEMKNEIRIWIGGKMASNLRAIVFNELGYTCSIGIAHNKMLAKLASAKNKPNKQTFVLQRQVEPLMRQVPLAKIRFLGGKLGNLLSKLISIGENVKKKDIKVGIEHEHENQNEHEDCDYSSDHDSISGHNNHNQNQSIQKENSNSIIDPLLPLDDNISSSIHTSNDNLLMASDLWDLTISELQDKTGLDSNASKWVYNIIRGVDDSLVNPRTQAKSFQSTKNLQPAAKEWSVLRKWLPVLCTELKFRIEEDLQINGRWPQTLNVSFSSLKRGFHTRSIKFPHDRNFKVDLLINLVEKVLKQQEDLVPCTLIAIGVSRFISINSIAFNTGSLDKFLVATSDKEEQFRKLQQIDNSMERRNQTEQESKKEVKVKGGKSHLKTKNDLKKGSLDHSGKCFFKPIISTIPHQSINIDNDNHSTNTWKCPDCRKIFPKDIIQEHQDYHYALSLQYRP